MVVKNHHFEIEIFHFIKICISKNYRIFPVFAPCALCCFQTTTACASPCYCYNTLWRYVVFFVTCLLLIIDDEFVMLVILRIFVVFYLFIFISYFCVVCYISLCLWCFAVYLMCCHSLVLFDSLYTFVV